MQRVKHWLSGCTYLISLSYKCPEATEKMLRVLSLSSAALSDPENELKIQHNLFAKTLV
ncbi:hypothetical protein DPMN_139113 [Dreissena polymorpha]|uniref:Uncharacterized protein n=1 Tax=Dreissena polymorpha TaxID=45954 RepID=A0A9D4G8F6_DREPO|nr:hypothetical protein DPMN_139113 [Dreissena polymorpha]